MPEKTRVVCCGFDPMLVAGYIRTNQRAIWWYLPDELYEDYDVKPGDVVCGRLLAVYDYEGKKVAEPNLDFEWSTARESGLAVVVPSGAILKFKLTAWHFLEMEITKIKKLKGYEEKVIRADEERGYEEVESLDEVERVVKVPVYDEFEVYPGEEKCRKWWPDDKMKMEFHLDFVEP